MFQNFKNCLFNDKTVLKVTSKKSVPGILRFVSMLFLIFEKGMSKKTVPGILRFVSMLFNVIIF